MVATKSPIQNIETESRERSNVQLQLQLSHVFAGRAALVTTDSLGRRNLQR